MRIIMSRGADDVFRRLIICLCHNRRNADDSFDLFSSPRVSTVRTLRTADTTFLLQ
jgi:hypothetical protein